MSLCTRTTGKSNFNATLREPNGYVSDATIPETREMSLLLFL